MPVITLSYLPHCFGEEIARRLSLKLSIPLLNRERLMQTFLKDISNPYDIQLLDTSPKHYLRNAKNKKNIRDNLITRMNHYADSKNAILLGIAPALFLQKHPNVLHVSIYSSEESMVTRCMEERKFSKEQALAQIQQNERLFKRFGKILFDQESENPQHYHVQMNTSLISVDVAITLITELYKDMSTRSILMNSTDEESKVRYRNESSSVMKNPSEIRFAQVLDMHNLRWVYEPKTFPLEWHADGAMKSAFSPDFYLPEYDLYIELTVMDSRYMQEKKKKIQLMNQLYPDINVKLVERKNFAHLERSLFSKSSIRSLFNEEGEINYDV